MQQNTPEVYQPTDEELKARNRRNVAIAVALTGFMVFVFVTMILRSRGAA